MAEPSVFVVTDAALARLATATLDLEGEFYAVLADDGAAPTAEGITNLEDVSGGGAEAVTELLVEETTGYEDVEFTGAVIEPSTGTKAFDSVLLEFDDGEASEITAKWLIVVEGELGAGARDPEHLVLGYMDLDDTGTEATVSSVAGIFTVDPPATGWFTLDHSNEP